MTLRVPHFPSGAKVIVSSSKVLLALLPTALPNSPGALLGVTLAVLLGLSATTLYVRPCCDRPEANAWRFGFHVSAVKAASMING